MASFEIVDDSEIPRTETAQFKRVGCDIFADVFVAIYDPTLDYNLSHNIDLKWYKPIKIDFTNKLNKGDTVCTLENIGIYSNKSFIEGDVMDPEYSGIFSNIRPLSFPDSILINMITKSGISGSPLFVGNPNVNGDLKCVGMMNGLLANNSEYSIAISGFTLQETITRVINIYNIYSPIYYNNIRELNYITSSGLSARWLGVQACYFSPILDIPNKMSLDYTGGLVITDFIIGFDYGSSEFVTGYKDNTTQQIINLNTPLLNTNMYNRFINNNRIPIILKAVTMYDNLQSSYNKYYLGKFSNQVSYSHLVYGIAPIGNVPNDPKYTNPLINIYGDITLEYYYFNGKEWLLDEETICGRSMEYYNEYNDNEGHLFLQNVLEFPNVLIPYIYPYLAIQLNKLDLSNLTGLLKRANKAMNSTGSGITNNARTLGIDGGVVAGGAVLAGAASAVFAPTTAEIIASTLLDSQTFATAGWMDGPILDDAILGGELLLIDTSE
jgi:hypothetical protein